MKRSICLVLVALIASSLMALGVYAKEYNSETKKDFTASGWTVAKNDSNGVRRLDGTYTITTSGALWWKETTYKAVTTGHTKYSSAYVATTLWTGSDWDVTFSEDVKNGECSATPVSYTHLDVYKRQSNAYVKIRFKDDSSTFDTTSGVSESHFVPLSMRSNFCALYQTALYSPRASPSRPTPTYL